jgi:hypothetical protein
MKNEYLFIKNTSMKVKFASLLLCLFFLITACSNEKEEATGVAISIVESSVDFTAAGGTGVIKTNATKEISASVNQTWCTVSVVYNTVTVITPMNKGMEGRTALIKILVDGTTLSVPVTQQAAIFAVSSFDIKFEGRGGRQAIAVKNTLPQAYEIGLENSEWLRYETKEDSLIIYASASNVVRRTNKVRLTLYERTFELTVEQVSIAGNYQITYADYDGKPFSGQVALTTGEKEGTYFLSGDLPRDISILCTYRDNTLIINAGQYLKNVEHTSAITGEQETLMLLLSATNSEREILTFWDQVTYVAPLEIDENYVITFKFGDGGTWTDVGPVNGISTGGFGLAGYYYGRFDSLINIILVSVSVGG